MATIGLNGMQWSEGLLDHNTTTQRLRKMDVLGDYYWATSLCGRTLVEGPCMDLTVRTIFQRNCGQATIFTLLPDALRFPVFDSDMIKNKKFGSIWSTKHPA